MLPSDPIDEDVDRDAVVSFLQKKGSIEMLVVIADGGARYSEIVEQTRIVDSTVNIRRTEAVELNLIEVDARPGDEGMIDFYVLTALGKAIGWYIHQTGVDRVFWKLQALREEYDELSEEMVEQLTDEETDLEQFRNRMLRYENYDQLDPEYTPPWKP